LGDHGFKIECKKNSTSSPVQQAGFQKQAYQSGNQNSFQWGGGKNKEKGRLDKLENQAKGEQEG